MPRYKVTDTQTLLRLNERAASEGRAFYMKDTQAVDPAGWAVTLDIDPRGDNLITVLAVDQLNSDDAIEAWLLLTSEEYDALGPDYYETDPRVNRRTGFNQLRPFDGDYGTDLMALGQRAGEAQSALEGAVNAPDTTPSVLKKAVNDALDAWTWPEALQSTLEAVKEELELHSPSAAALGDVKARVGRALETA